jgi:UPF0176 protein
MSVLNLAAYRFVALDDLPALRESLAREARARGLLGTILLAFEGINLFLAGDPAALRGFRDVLEADHRFAGMEAKESWSRTRPFKRLRVRIKREIVSSGRADVRPGEAPAPRLSAGLLRRWLDEGREVVLLDTRNRFEFERGSFAGALHWENESFRAFANAAQRRIAELPRAPVVTFCTGGIRCEKAAPLLQSLGHPDVYQLDGGILRYFELEGGAHYRGDCFVFDDRVALDHGLRPANDGPLSILES